MRMTTMLALLALAAAAACQTTLRVEVNDIHSDDGLVLLSLFAGAEGFPTQPAKAYRQARAGIEDGRCVIELADIPPGEYAISIMHDENNNDYMDSNWLGIPQEGWGASNDPKVTFGPPKWSDSFFVVSGERITVPITMRY